MEFVVIIIIIIRIMIMIIILFWILETKTSFGRGVESEAKTSRSVVSEQKGKVRCLQ